MCIWKSNIELSTLLNDKKSILHVYKHKLFIDTGILMQTCKSACTQKVKVKQKQRYVY
jgi:hypothetical protein